MDFKTQTSCIVGYGVWGWGGGGRVLVWGGGDISSNVSPVFSDCELSMLPKLSLIARIYYG